MRTCICGPVIASLLVHLVIGKVVGQQQTILVDLGASSQTIRNLVYNVTVILRRGQFTLSESIE
jgi:hypothetical protein